MSNSLLGERVLKLVVYFGGEDLEVGHSTSSVLTYRRYSFHLAMHISLIQLEL